MAELTIAQQLQYAKLQMASEAFLYDEQLLKLKSDLATALTMGNKHSSKFATQTEADNFLKEWDVVAQQPNTSSGFSGTLFQNRTTHEFVISFRSTEFIDDAVNDCQTTNKTIADFGWAFGQISDMQEWYNTTVKEKIGNNQVSLTGYSLGGHLATAFAMLHKADTASNGQPLVKEVVTFNGAGVGVVKSGKLLGGAGKAAMLGMQSALNQLLRGRKIRSFWDGPHMWVLRQGFFA